MKNLFKKIWKAITSYPDSFDDYFTVGRWLVYKKLAVMGTVLLILGLAFLGWLLLRPEKPYEIPSFYYFEDRLKEYSGEAVLLDGLDRTVYKGKIAAGLCDGVGSRFAPSNESLVYEGEFTKGDYGGQGKLYQNGTLLYEGGFLNGRYSGNGTLYEADRIRYQGDFSKGVFDGKGTLFQTGKLLYEGFFLDGAYHGEGTLYNTEGALLYKGGFSQGKFEGTGIQTAADGAVIYEGSFRGGLYDGQGWLYAADGGRLQFKGTFQQGRPGISGDLYNTRGQRLYSGEIYNGRVDYAALLGLPVAELQKRVLELPVIYYDSGFVGYLYAELSFAVVTRYDYSSLQENSESGASEVPSKAFSDEYGPALFTSPEDNLVADLLLVDGRQFSDRLLPEGAVVSRDSLTGFEAFMESRLAGLQDATARLWMKARVMTRGDHLYEVADLPKRVDFHGTGVFYGGVHYFYRSEGTEKGGVPQIIFFSRIGNGG